MDVYEVFAVGTAAWSATMLVPDNAMHPLTDLERYLSKALGFSVLGLALLFVLLSGMLPIVSSMSARPTALQQSSAAGAYVPSLWVGVLYHIAMSLLQYVWGSSQFRSTAYLASTVNGLLAVMGGWILLFALDKEGLIKHRAFTADGGKASSFPFKNKLGVTEDCLGKRPHEESVA